MTEEARPDEDKRKPTIFISHSHEDKQLADVIRLFLENRSLGQIDVFQSSEAGQGLQIGGRLNEELLEQLRYAEVVILVYTSANRDWSYCMWECGVALDPTSPDTSIIVLQFTEDAPAPFLDTVRVDGRKSVDIQNFVTQFLTAPGFLPRYGRAIAPSMSPDDPGIAGMAEEFLAELEKVTPSDVFQPDEEWPVFSFLRLELNFDHVDAVRIASKEEGRETVRMYLTARASDQEAAGHFGMMSIPVGTSFDELLSSWERDATQTQHDWISSLLDQVVLATRLKSPDLEWNLMRSEDDHNWYATSIHQVRNVNSRSCMQFDVEFLPFQVGSGARSIEIPLPE